MIVLPQRILSTLKANLESFKPFSKLTICTVPAMLQKYQQRLLIKYQVSGSLSTFFYLY